tara:strand:- start:3096 stop:3560 length:465 start_codon:yes stop_codon:yes gene_type:complete
MDSEISFEESSDLFHSESNQLQDVINSALKSEKLTISEMVQSYYQVMKVSSISKILKDNFQSSTDPKHQDLVNKIHHVQKQITEKFDAKLHPLIVSQLTDSIQKYTGNLQSLDKNSGQKSKQGIEIEANLYKELRELMSTKEFVEQYENGLKDD